MQRHPFAFQPGVIEISGVSDSKQSTGGYGNFLLDATKVTPRKKTLLLNRDEFEVERGGASLYEDRGVEDEDDLDNSRDLDDSRSAETSNVETRRPSYYGSLGNENDVDSSLGLRLLNKQRLEKQLRGEQSCSRCCLRALQMAIFVLVILLLTLALVYLVGGRVFAVGGTC